MRASLESERAMDSPLPGLDRPAASSTSMRVEELPPRAVLIVLMGPSGAGKTFLISKATEKNLQLGHGLESATSEISLHPLREGGVFLVDTTGFDDTNKTDIDILEGFISFLHRIDRSGHRISGIIYLHRITDNRVSGSTRRNFQMLMGLCGKHFLPHVVLATTMWRQLDDPESNRRQDELEGSHWKEMIDGGAVARKYEGTTQSAIGIIDILLRQPLNYDTMPDIQRESVREKMPLLETGAGRVVYEGIKQRLQQYDRSVEKIKKECKELEREVSSSSEYPKPERGEEIRELMKEQMRLWDQRERLERLLQGRVADGSFTQSVPIGDSSSSQETGTAPGHEPNLWKAESALRGQPEIPNEQSAPAGVLGSGETSSGFARLCPSGKADPDSPSGNIYDRSDLSTHRGHLLAKAVPRVCVVGAGLSGLRCAEILLRNGCDVTIIEARSRIGGRVYESTELGYSIDVGPNWVSGCRYDPLIDIAKEANAMLQPWNGKCNIFDISGDPIDEQKATSFTKLVRNIVEEPIEFRSQNGAGIPESDSVYDYFVHRSKEILLSDGGSPESQQEQLLQRISQMWCTYIGDPIERQSLRFAGMEHRCSGEKTFFTNMYGTICDRAKKLQDAHVYLSSRVVEIRTLGADRTSVGVVVKTEDKKEQTFEFDEVVMTTPIGWLKQNKNSFLPPLTPRLVEAIDGISVGRLEKVFIAFPEAFWKGSQNTETPFSPHRPQNTNSEFPGHTIWLSPTYAPDVNPGQWSQEAYDLTDSVSPNSQPTLLFCVYGDCSAHLTNLVRETSRPQRNDLLEKFFRPYFSRLPYYSYNNPVCHPTAFHITDWQHDEFAGYGSYCSIQVGARDATRDVETLQIGLPERRLWFAGEHTAPLHIGTATGAYLSGEEVAKKVFKACHGRGEKAAEEALKEIKIADRDVG
ncbi:MAG: hypothetical protein M1839_003125 [Geoglossum umbratile]|nr:MAG: hypothetical protein M1839_003125 [Geoglossum umbratile]